MAGSNVQALSPQSAGYGPRSVQGDHKMQSQFPLAPHPSIQSWHVSDMQQPFSMGSSPSGHSPHQVGRPSTRCNATAAIFSRTGYVNSLSTAMAPTAFPSQSAWMRADKSPASSPSNYPPPHPMAVPFSAPQASEEFATPDPSARPGLEVVHGSPGADTTGSESPSPHQENAQATGDNDKRKHPCWMCHKSFDRPSTLKKHLLVHTGEKAFACETCGRRFGVLSNLNRHAKRCASRPVNAAAPAMIATSASASASAGSISEVARNAVEAGPSSAAGPSTAAAATDPSADSQRPTPSRSRKRKEAPTTDNNAVASSSAADGRAKRTRRAPSPTPWVPDSLKSFDLTLPMKGTPVPLSPVRPFQDANGRVVEERDSFDENASPTPYHPQGWKGKLPGPGLMGKDVANTSGGRLLIF